MANVAHSSLTGSNLHEPKGVAAAAAGKVYVTDGAGSGTFTTLTDTDIFGHRLLHVRYRVGPTDNNDNLYNSDSWTTTLLNTVETNEISGASLATNQITLPAGTYFATATVTIGDPGPQCLRLKDLVGDVTKVLGLRYPANTTIDDITASLNLQGRFTLSGSTALDLQVWSSEDSNFSSEDNGEDLIYTDVLIWKIA